MNKTDRLLSNILTGNSSIDCLLRQAFLIGLQHGQASDRDNVAQNAKIDTTAKLLLTLIRNQKISLEEAMVIFAIPKADRDIYRRIVFQRMKN